MIFSMIDFISSIFNKSLVYGFVLGVGILTAIFLLINRRKQKRLKAIADHLKNLASTADFLEDKEKSAEADEFFNKYGDAIEAHERELKNVNYLIFDFKVYYLMATYFVWNNNKNRAFEYFEKAFKLEPTNQSAKFGYAGALLGLAKYEKAIKLYEEIVDKKHRVADCYYNIGWIFDELGEYTKAIEYYEKSLLVTPDNYWAKYNIACALTKLKDFDKVISTLKEVIGEDKVKDFIRTDEDFDAIRNDKTFGPQFVALINTRAKTKEY